MLKSSGSMEIRKEIVNILFVFAQSEKHFRGFGAAETAVEKVAVAQRYLVLPKLY